MQKCIDPSLSPQKFMFKLQAKALAKKANKAEKTKNKKAGSRMWDEVHELGELVRRSAL